MSEGGERTEGKGHVSHSRGAGRVVRVLETPHGLLSFAEADSDRTSTKDKRVVAQGAPDSFLLFAQKRATPSHLSSTTSDSCTMLKVASCAQSRDYAPPTSATLRGSSYGASSTPPHTFRLFSTVSFVFGTKQIVMILTRQHASPYICAPHHVSVAVRLSRESALFIWDRIARVKKRHCKKY